MDRFQRWPRLALVLVCALAWSCGQTMTTPAPSPAPSRAGEWPTYGHDVARTSYNPDETVVSSSTLANLAPSWQVDIGSNGTPPSGAPTVSGGQVFVGSSASSGPNFFAFNAASGMPIWSANIGYKFAPECGNDFNVGIGSTSAVLGSVVSVGGGGDGAYYGLDAGSGQILWRQPLNVGPSGFTWSSPLSVGGVVYFGVASQCDNPSVRGEVRAVSLASGSLLAQQFFVSPGASGAGVWNSPALSPDGSTLVVATGEDGGTHGTLEQAIVSLDPRTLAILQSDKEGPTDQDLDFASTPLVFSDSRGRTLVGANHKDGVFYAYVLANITGGPLWLRSVGVVVGLAPAYDPTLLNGGTLFFGGTDSSGNPQLHAVDPATGADRWPPVSVPSMAGNIAVANHLIFVNAGGSGLLVLDEGSGATLRVLTPAGAGSAFSGVAVAGGAVYWLSGSALNVWRVP